MSLSRKRLTLQPRFFRTCLAVSASVLAVATAGICQNAPNAGAPKYDLQTEMKTKGVIEEVNVLTVGSRKDFTELVLKIGADKLHIYVCPKPFQDEM